MNVQIALGLLSEKAIFTAGFIKNFNKLFNISNSFTFYNSNTFIIVSHFIILIK